MRAYTVTAYPLKVGLIIIINRIQLTKLKTLIAFVVTYYHSMPVFLNNPKPYIKSKLTISPLHRHKHVNSMLYK